MADRPIDWPPYDFTYEGRDYDAFTQLVAEAHRDLEAPDRAADAARDAAFPVSGAEVDDGDDQDLLDGAAAFAQASSSRGELQVGDELAALDALDATTADQAGDFPPDQDVPPPLAEDDPPDTGKTPEPY